MMTVFACQKCGKCCDGRGGTVLGEGDIARLAAFLQRTPQDFLTEFSETIAGKPRIVAGVDGFCIFFQRGKGCSVHAVKPDVCRAWPFFRGNLIDEVSFLLAREDCPGISRGCTHQEFAKAGLAMLAAEGLLAAANADAPNALKSSSLQR